MPTNKQILKARMQEEMLENGLRRRLSPLGIEEFIVPENLQGKFNSGQNLAETRWTDKGPIISYREKYAYDPTIQTHERIHAGQDLLENKPSLDQIIQSMQFESRPELQAGYDTFFPHSEIPAYQFMRPMYDPEEREEILRRGPKDYRVGAMNRIEAEQQGKVNRYLDLMNKINYRNTEPLEAAMPDQLIREYIKSHAQPLFPPKVIK